MKALLKTLCLVTTLLVSAASVAGEAVPINATFGIQWTPVDWSNLTDRVTETAGAAGLPNGTTLAIVTRDHLNALEGKVSSDYVIIAFSAADWVYARYENLPAGYNPTTNTASFGGPLTVVGGEGKFVGATGTLSIRSSILFSLPVGTFAIKGVIKTAD